MKHTHGWRLIAMLAVLALFAAACGDDDDDVATDTTEPTDTTETSADEGDGDAAALIEESPTLTSVVASGQITIGTKFDQPLFGQVDPTAGGEPVGFDVEIAQLIVEKLEAASGETIEIEFVETPSAIRETAITDGTVDMVVATYTINDSRKEQIAFAGPYYVAGQDIMVAADDDSITGVEDLAGKRVCSVQGSTSIENLREQAPEAELVEYDVYSKCADDLGNGRVDAVSTDNVILVGLIDAEGDSFKLVDNPFTEEPYGIGVPKDDQAMRDFVNDVLEEIFESGEWAEAYESTVGTVAESTPEPPEVDRY
ncbi:MAG: glutamate ABC transporter substrate-binding protein [Acidimicrobiales bacterium]